MQETDRILSTSEAAKVIGISKHAMKMRAYRGMIPTTRGAGGKYQYKMSDVMATIDNSAQDANVPVTSDTIVLREVSELLGIPYQTLWVRVIKDGLDPRPIGKIDGKWRFSRAGILGNLGAKYDNIIISTHTQIKKDEKSGPLNSGKYGIEYVTIEARCPACSDVRMRRVVKGSSKWIYCPKHEKYRNANLSQKEGNRISFRDIREY